MFEINFLYRKYNTKLYIIYKVLIDCFVDLQMHSLGLPDAGKSSNAIFLNLLFEKSFFTVKL